MNLMGLGGLLTFNAGNSLGTMGAVRNAMAGISSTAAGLQSGLRGVALALVPVVAGMGLAYKAGLDFENQMAAVQAVAQGSVQELDMLATKAKAIGAASSYTATEIASGMELLARAGFRTQEILSGIGGVAAAAAADAMPMARAAEVIGTTIRGMGLQAKDMQRVADVMAYTSAASNTSITDLGYGFAYGQATARQLNISLEATAAAMGKISDAGNDGSVMGTSLTQMLNHLAAAKKPQVRILTQMFGANWRKEVSKAFQITPEEAAAGVSAVTKLVQLIEPKLKSYKGVLDKTAIQNTLFGIHGVKAWNALTAAGVPALEEMTRANLNAAGAAQKMADMRLDSVIGQLTLLRSAAEGVSIEFFDKFLRPAGGAIREVRVIIGDLAVAMQLLRSKDILDMVGPPTEEMQRKRVEWARISTTVKNFAMGVNTAIDTVVAKYTALRDQAGGILRRFIGETDEAQQQWFGRIITYGALASPVLLGLTTAVLGLGAAFAIMAPLVKGVLALVAGFTATALLKPLLLAGAAFMIFRREGESVGETFLRLWTTVSTAAMDFWSNVLMPIVTGIRDEFAPVMQPLWEAWQSIFGSIRTMIGYVFSFFSSGAREVRTDWLTIAKTIAHVVARILLGVTQMVQGVVFVVARIVGALGYAGLMIGNFLLTPLRMAWTLILGIAETMRGVFRGSFTEALMGVSKAIVEFILTPFREIVKLMVQTNDFFGRATPQGMRDFAFGSVQKMPTIQTPEPNQSLSTDGVSQSMIDYGEARSLPPVLAAQVVIEDKREIDVNVTTELDGKTLAFAQAKHQVELTERTGARATPWQRKSAVDFGALVAP